MLCMVSAWICIANLCTTAPAPLQVRCVSGCTCPTTYLDGTWEQQVSLQFIHRFKVRSGPELNSGAALPTCWSQESGHLMCHPDTACAGGLLTNCQS